MSLLGMATPLPHRGPESHHIKLVLLRLRRLQNLRELATAGPERCEKLLEEQADIQLRLDRLGAPF